jgi:very-short-patch-repair endonuclease
MNKDHRKLIECRKNSKPSSGEKKVMAFLRKNRVKFRREHFFPELTNDQTGHLLFFDFYVSSLNLVIEVDGKQHFVAINGKHQFNSLVHRDNLKNRFCKLNEITICRLTYEDLRTMEKLKNAISGCACTHKVVEQKKGLKKLESRKAANCGIKAKKEKKIPVNERVRKKKQDIGKRVGIKNQAWMEEVERKRQQARLRYPTDVRIYLADKNKESD